VLILSLWALLLLSAAIFAWLKFINFNISLTAQRNDGLEAKALAHSGVMVALDPQVTVLTPLLRQQFENDRSYKVEMTGEGGRLNLNWLFTPAETPDPAKIALFQRYLEGRGLNLEQRNHLTDCILDWLSTSNIPHMNGAVADANYHPPKRDKFLSVDEIAEIKGSDPLVSQAGWKDDFTIYYVNPNTTAGQIDLQWASRRILLCLPGVGEMGVDRFLQMREGPDGVNGTADDHIFNDATEALSYLGATGPVAQQLQNFVYVEAQNGSDFPLSLVHILSTGQVGNIQRQVEVVARKVGMQPMIMSWKEL
jgi:hypothetical protein